MAYYTKTQESLYAAAGMSPSPDRTDESLGGLFLVILFNNNNLPKPSNIFLTYSRVEAAVDARRNLDIVQERSIILCKRRKAFMLSFVLSF